MWEYSGLFYGLLSVSHNTIMNSNNGLNVEIFYGILSILEKIVMDLNNVMQMLNARDDLQV